MIKNKYLKLCLKMGMPPLSMRPLPYNESIECEMVTISRTTKDYWIVFNDAYNLLMITSVTSS